MKALATIIMRGRMQAVLLTTFFGVLSLILPPFSYISGAVVALVTLRNGDREGLFVVGAASLIIGGLSLVSMGSPVLAGIFALVVWVPVWLLAVVLRRTVSMPLTLAVAGLIAMLAVVAAHLMLGDPVAWWESVLDKLFAATLEQQPMELSGVTGASAQLMTAIMASALLLSMAISLFLGRWWQALLYNPGGFGKEFYGLRLDKTGALLGLVVVIWAVADGEMGSLPADLSVVVMTLYALPGLALVHDWVTKTSASVIWLVLLYLALVFLPQIAAVLALLGLADSWSDLRRFIKSSDK